MRLQAHRPRNYTVVPGLKGLLDDAAARLAAAGYTGASCRTERVLCPQCPTGYYEQNVCDAPGYMGASNADLIMSATTAAHPGYGVDLAAQHAYDVAHGAGVGTNDYFNTYGSGSGTVVTAGSANYTGTVDPTGKMPTLRQVQSSYDDAIAKLAAQGNKAATAPLTPAGTPAPAGTNAGSGSTTLPAAQPVQDNTMLYIALAGGAALLLFAMKG